MRNSVAALVMSGGTEADTFSRWHGQQRRCKPCLIERYRLGADLIRRESLVMLFAMWTDVEMVFDLFANRSCQIAVDVFRQILENL